MAFVFRPPTADTLSPVYVAQDTRPVTKVANDLFRHYKPRAVGQTVLIDALGVCRTTSYPSQDELDAAAFVFQGGHEYQISDDLAQILIDAGYDVDIE